jgi:hypothetical protein
MIDQRIHFTLARPSLLIISLPFLIGICSAQGIKQDLLPRMRFRVRAGINMSQLTGTSGMYNPVILYHDYKLNQKPVMNVIGGGTMEYRLNRKFSLLGELLLALEGGKSKTDITYFASGAYSFQSYTFRFTKLNVPFLLRYYVNKRISVESGPQAGIFLSAKLTYQAYNSLAYNNTYEFNMLRDGQATGTSLTNPLTNKRGVKVFDFGLLFSMTYHVNKNAGIQVRYTRGFSPIDMNADLGNQFYLNSNFKSSVLQLSVEYKF